MDNIKLLNLDDLIKQNRNYLQKRYRSDNLEAVGMIWDENGLLKFSGDILNINLVNTMLYFDLFNNTSAFYSELSLALLINYIPRPLPTNILETIDFNLNVPVFKDFSSERYPMVHELKKVGMSDELNLNKLNSSTPVFYKFLDMCMTFEDENITSFLFELDRNKLVKNIINDFIKKLESKSDEFFDEYFNEEKTQYKLISGVFRFLELIVRYESLLRQSREIKQLENAFWQHIKYWVNLVKLEIKDEIFELIKSYLFVVENIDFYRDDYFYYPFIQESRIKEKILVEKDSILIYNEYKKSISRLFDK